MPGLWLWKSARLRPDSAIIASSPDLHSRPMRMAKPKSFFRVFTERGPLIALAVAVALLVGIAGPASAQFFFNFGGPPRPQPRSSGRRLVRRRPLRAVPAAGAEARVVREDFSKAPPPEKRDTVPERNVLVLGDAMADWLAYGLEDAYAEQPDMGVIRKHKTVSGLIKYQPKGEPADWAAAAKGILATEKPDAIVVMLGLNDRVPIREPVGREIRTRRSRQEGCPRQAGCQAARIRQQAGWRRRRRKARRQAGRYRIVAGRRRRRRAAGRSRRRRARARRTASMSFARSAGSSSTPRRSKR